MKALIFDGTLQNDPAGGRVRAALASELRARGWEAEHVLLREHRIGNCAGDFFCWVRSPGLCNIDDDNRKLAAEVTRSDLLVYLTPVTFGGYSSELKKMVDHQIQNVLPYFSKVDGETHHQKRYAAYPDLLVIGWMDEADGEAQAVFQNLARRNAVNMFARRYAVGIALAGQVDESLRTNVRDWLDDLGRRKRIHRENPRTSAEGTRGGGPIRRVVLLVGSPRTRKSTSQSLGGYLTGRLAARGVATETFFLHTSLRSPERMRSLLASCDAADLVVLASPLYVDALPAPAVQALERIAVHRAGSARAGAQSFAAIINCGFPEAEQNSTAVAICATFARQAGFTWAGALSLGAGEGMVHGVPLNEMDGRGAPLKRALDLAAEALAQGKPVPQSAQDLWARPFIPPWLYRAAGVFGWRQQAKRWGAEKALKRQPYAEK